MQVVPLSDFQSRWKAYDPHARRIWHVWIIFRGDAEDNVYDNNVRNLYELKSNISNITANISSMSL